MEQRIFRSIQELLSDNIVREGTSDGVTELRKENQLLKEMVANLVLRYDIIKKLTHVGLMVKAKKYLRLKVCEKQEIIHIVTRSEIRVNRKLQEIRINKNTLHNQYHAYSENGVEGLVAQTFTSGIKAISFNNSIALIVCAISNPFNLRSGFSET